MFKLMQEGGSDFPVLICDVCSQRIADLWNDLASGSHVDGGLGNVVIHHKKCPTQEPLHMPLVDFFGLFMVKNRIGDLATCDTVERISLNHEVGGGFE
jgi:hypothetical protein